MLLVFSGLVVIDLSKIAYLCGQRLHWLRLHLQCILGLVQRLGDAMCISFGVEDQRRTWPEECQLLIELEVSA
jgi:hypothetical protein